MLKAKETKKKRAQNVKFEKRMRLYVHIKNWNQDQAAEQYA